MLERNYLFLSPLCGASLHHTLQLGAYTYQCFLWCSPMFTKYFAEQQPGASHGITVLSRCYMVAWGARFSKESMKWAAMPERSQDAKGRGRPSILWKRWVVFVEPVGQLELPSLGQQSEGCLTERMAGKLESRICRQIQDLHANFGTKERRKHRGRSRSCTVTLLSFYPMGLKSILFLL